jgi:hypothetical protein
VMSPPPQFGGPMGEMPGEEEELDEVEEVRVDNISPVEILQKMRSSIGAPVEKNDVEEDMLDSSFVKSSCTSRGSSSFKAGPSDLAGDRRMTLSDVLSMKNKDDQSAVALNQALKEFGDEADAPAAAALSTNAEAKLDQLLRAQAATAQQVEKMDQKLTRLDALAASVAAINLTLKKASTDNQARQPYKPPRPPMRLPGQRPPPKPKSGGSPGQLDA